MNTNWTLITARSGGGGYAGASAGGGVGASAAFGGGLNSETGGGGGVGAESHVPGKSTKVVKLSQFPDGETVIWKITLWIQLQKWWFILFAGYNC